MASCWFLACVWAGLPGRSRARGASPGGGAAGQCAREDRVTVCAPGAPVARLAGVCFSARGLAPEAPLGRSCARARGFSPHWFGRLYARRARVGEYDRLRACCAGCARSVSSVSRAGLRRSAAAGRSLGVRTVVSRARGCPAQARLRQKTPPARRGAGAYGAQQIAHSPTSRLQPSRILGEPPPASAASPDSGGPAQEWARGRSSVWRAAGASGVGGGFLALCARLGRAALGGKSVCAQLFSRSGELLRQHVASMRARLGQTKRTHVSGVVLF